MLGRLNWERFEYKLNLVSKYREDLGRLSNQSPIVKLGFESFKVSETRAKIRLGIQYTDESNCIVVVGIWVAR